MTFLRLEPGDEAAAIRVVETVKPPAERDGASAGARHMRALLADERNYFLVARVPSGADVGFLVAHRFPCADRDRFIVYLYDVYVQPEYRGRGAASGMVALLKRSCPAEQVLELWAGTSEDNAAARRLLESMGARAQPSLYVEYVYRPGSAC